MGGDKDDDTKEESKVVHVETEEIPGDQLRSITNNYDATVVKDDGSVGESSGITKERAIEGAVNDAD
jgi:hypothetical protein